jgi:uncharacterized sulfatase
MSMKRIAVLIGVGLVLALALGWFNRHALLLEVIKRTGKVEVAENRPVPWQSGPVSAADASAQRPPNVVFILVDDLGINDLDTFGGGVASGRVPTPNITKLAQSGALFTQAYSGTGTCAPSRAMLLTGRYPTRTGFEFTPTPDGMSRLITSFSNANDTGLPPVRANPAAREGGLTFEEQGLPGDEVTLAEILQAVGYHTVHIGKWHLGRSEQSRPNAQGFDESLLMASGLFLPEDDPNVVNAKLDSDPIDIFLWARMQFAASYNFGDWFEPGGYLTDYWTDEAVKVIRANKNRPFFLYLAHWGVHTPLQATREDYEAVGDIAPHRLRVYAAMVRALDRSVGEIVAALEEEGLMENTIIVFTSDNGGAGYLGIPDVNAPYRGWKITLFEGGIRVPMFVSWPGQIPAGQQIASPVAHIDVMPTLAAAAGAPLPEGVVIDGQNLLPIATGSGPLTRPDDALYWSSGPYRVVRAGGWKLQVDGLQGKSWLFDLNTDPTEQVNLIVERTDKRAELEALMTAHWKDARAPLYTHAIEGAIAIDKTLAEKATPEDEYVIWPN